MKEKAIYKCRVGSHLYGTNRPTSDEDYAGVMLHSLEQVLGLQNPPSEKTENVKLSDGPRNAFGDVDCKFFYLPRFMQLAAQGQPGQLEMFFAPPEAVLLSTPEWDLLKANRDLFLSKKGISPFIGFALAQAHKAVIKGENLNLIRDLIGLFGSMTASELQQPMSSFFTGSTDEDYELCGKVRIKRTMSEDGRIAVLQIAGRKFDLGLSAKKFLGTITTMEEKYGTRVRAAAEEKYDYKSLGHAVRLLSEAEEFLATGIITLPRPDADFVRSILTGEVEESYDWLEYITKRIDNIRQVVEPNSILPEAPDWARINQLCIEMQKTHLLK